MMHADISHRERGHGAARRGGAAALPALALLSGLALAWSGPLAPVRAAEPPLELKWSQLMPPAPPAPPKSFLAGRPPGLSSRANPHGTASAAAQPEGRWMSGPASRSEAPAAVVASLDGQRVRIGGYVVSLDFDATRVKEFLLVPFVGACIHVPPPPANQIVYVKSAQGFEVSGMFEPVWVTGTLKVSTAFTGLAEAGYSLEAEKVEYRNPG